MPFGRGKPHDKTTIKQHHAELHFVILFLCSKKENRDTNPRFRDEYNYAFYGYYEILELSSPHAQRYRSTYENSPNMFTVVTTMRYCLVMVNYYHLPVP